MVMINQIDTLLSQGVLNRAQASTLRREIQQAIKLINKGRISGAIDNLKDFNSEAKDLFNSGVLTQGQYKALTRETTHVINQLKAL